jgi:hypothetical protein
VPTVMLTTTCPNECPWCFARAKMDRYTAAGITEMAWKDFLQGAQNGSFVALDRYETLLDLLDWWPAMLRKNGFSCALDCHSIPRCSLPEEGNATRPFSYRSTCSSFMIDIGPGLVVWPCFPLSGETYRLEE